MAHTYAELRELSDDDLITEHDAQAAHTVMGLGYYQDELRRRDDAKPAERMEQMTGQLRILTVVVAVSSVVSMVAVLVSLVR